MKFTPLAILLLIITSMPVLCGCKDDSVESVSADSRPSTTIEEGPVRVTATVSSNQITIAQRVECILRVTAPAEYEIEFPRLADSLGDYTIVDSFTAPPALARDGQMAWTLTLTLEPFLPGVYAIEPIEISVRDRGTADPSILRLKLPVVTVASVLDDSPESASIGELKMALDPPTPETAEETTRTLAVAIGILVLLLVCMSAWLYLRRKRSLHHPDPCRAALTDLVALAGSPSISDHDVDIAYDAVRTCLSETVEPAAASLTASQLIASSGVRRLLSSDDQASLGDCLSRFERMQYAPDTVATSTMRVAISEAARLAALLVDASHDRRSTSTNGQAVEGAA